MLRQLPRACCHSRNRTSGSSPIAGQMALEIKRNQPMQSSTTALAAELKFTSAVLRNVKQQLVRKVDRWRGQLPIRLVASILEFSSSREIAVSQAVCESWRLPQNLSD